MNRARRLLEWAWSRSAAFIAATLVCAAFALGYWIAKPPTSSTAELDRADAADEPARTPQVYTCSMHPSVRLPDPDAKCPICFMDLIPVTDDATEGNELRISMSNTSAATSRIETAPVARFFPTAEVRLYGKATYDETSVARLSAYFPGRIERLFVNYVGVQVTAGDHMAEVYSPELLAAFEELRQAAAASNADTGSALVRAATQDTLAAAREKLRLFGLTQDQIAAIEEGRFESDRIAIRAPIGGVVTRLAVREGDYLQTGAPIATVADLSRLWLDL